jgi:hypothetical protein
MRIIGNDATISPSAPSNHVKMKIQIVDDRIFRAAAS